MEQNTKMWQKLKINKLCASKLQIVLILVTVFNEFTFACVVSYFLSPLVNLVPFSQFYTLLCCDSQIPTSIPQTERKLVASSGCLQ